MIKENESLKDKNYKIEIELSKINPFVEKFIFISQKLDIIMNNQKAVFDRADLGFRSYAKQKSTNNLCKKSSNKNMTCSYSRKLGHKFFVCKFKRNMKQIWIIKGFLRTNHEGPKKA